jgi:predicted amidophosphoribosyltransferase
MATIGGGAGARAASWLLGLLAPPRCLACGELAVGGRDQRLCSGCRLTLAAGPLCSEPIDGLAETRSAVPYSGPAVPLLARLKSGAAPAAAETMAELLTEALAPPEPDSTLVPVGADLGRRLRRGLDPAGELALALGVRLELPVAPILRRLDRRPQRGRGRRARLSRPPRFRALERSPERVLLVDDVITSGGTLRSCALALREAGATSVSAVAFARVPAAG